MLACRFVALGYRAARMRRVAVLAALAAVVGIPAVAGATTPGEPACRTAEVRVHDEVVFGHFASRSRAAALARHARKLGYMGIKLENEGCGDLEVEIDGADTQKQRTSFAAEAAKTGYAITFEQTAPPMAYQSGDVVGVLGRFSTLSAANALMWKLARNDFRYIDLVPQGARWLVVMPQVPVKNALSIAREVAKAGFHIQFSTGAKS
jgi:hypothetical protein